MGYIEERSYNYRVRYRDPDGNQTSKTFERKGEAVRFFDAELLSALGIHERRIVIGNLLCAEAVTGAGLFDDLLYVELGLIVEVAERAVLRSVVGDLVISSQRPFT